MSIPVLILGEPGTGKTFSCREFGRDEAKVIQTVPKLLPFNSDIETATSAKWDKIAQSIALNPDTPVFVVDDFGFTSTNTFVTDICNEATAKRDKFQVYNQIAADLWNFTTTVMNNGNTEQIVYIVMHEDLDENGRIVPATVGRLTNEKLKFIGLFTIVLHAVYRDGEYLFETNVPPFKSPLDMFEETIPNDLKAVDSRIREYYRIGARKGGKDA